MADFQQALTWMKAGRKVREAFWEPSVYWWIFNDEIQEHSCYPNKREQDQTAAPASVELMATDWELYEEPQPLFTRDQHDYIHDHIRGEVQWQLKEQVELTQAVTRLTMSGKSGSLESVLPALREGKRIRRRCWLPEKYWSTVAHNYSGSFEYVMLDMLESDWEIIE